jgi:DNA-binding NtrC family response regulator
MRAPSGRHKRGKPKNILSAGHNSAVLRLRNAVIETAGYRVVTTKESQLLLELAQNRDFDAVVLCNTIPTDLRESVVRELKSLRPNLPVVVLCHPREESRFENLADAVVVAQHGTSQPLIEALSKCVNDPEGPHT